MNAAGNVTLDATELGQLEQRLAEAGRLFAVTTVIRALPPTSTWVGAQALVESDGALHGWIGGGCSRKIVVQAALDAMRCGQPRLVRISNAEAAPEPGVELHAMPCASNGTIELFIQPTVPAPVVLILGSTPAALEAFTLAKRMGMRVYPAAHASEVYDLADAPRVLRGFNAAEFQQLDPDLILIATQGDGDEDALEAALRTSAMAILLIASARKAAQLRDTMRARGIDEARLAALHAPAGPRIHARTPQEIALGAVAGLVELRRLEEERMAAMVVERADSPAMQSVPPLAPCDSMAPEGRFVNPVCGMVVDFASARSIVERDGLRIPFCCDGCRQTFDRAPEHYVAIARAAPQRAAV